MHMNSLHMSGTCQLGWIIVSSLNGDQDPEIHANVYDTLQFSHFGCLQIPGLVGRDHMD